LAEALKNRSADGLRGIAAFNVVISHFFAAFLPTLLHKNYPVFPAEQAPGTAYEIFTSPLLSVFYNGHLPVLVFFALSGYVLTLPYFVDEHAAPVLQQRLWGRYLRLNVPIAAAILLSYAVYRLGLYANVQAAAVSGSTRWLAIFYPDGIPFTSMLREALFGSIVLGDATFIPPLWTLRVEFLGSLYVLAFFLVKPRGHLVLPMLPVFLLLYALYRQESIFFYVIFVGTMLNRVRFGRGTGLLLVVCGLYFGGFQFESAAYDFLPSIRVFGFELWTKKDFYSSLGAILLTAAVTQGFGKPFFEHRIVQFLGRISFPLYLLHFILLCSLASLIYLHFPQRPLFLALNFAVYACAGLLLASVFERYVDRKAIKLAHRSTLRLFGKAIYR
jgi:peptidoglycan/LPS O-acetylase OafA/YrhL